MRRAAPLLLFAIGLGLLGPGLAGAQTSGTTVDVVKVDGSIDRTVAGYVRDQLASAERSGDVVVIQLDTSGTLDQDAVALARRIFDARVPVIVWVGPEPAKGAGAGLLFMYAASLTAVAPGSQTGPLSPLDLADPSVAVPGLEDTIGGWLRARDKTTELPIHDRPLNAAEARHRGIAQIAAISVPDLLDKADGMTAQTAAGPETLHTRLATTASQPQVVLRFHDLGPVDRVLHSVASPSAIYLFLVLGLAALAFELTQPGFGFAGISGVAMLALATYGLTVVPFSWPGLALVLGGVALLDADVRLRRLGWLTGLGVAVFLAGSIVVFSRVSSEIDLSPWLIGFLVAASILYYGFGLTVAIQSRERITSTQRGLVGLVGEARGDLAPDGPVFVKGTLWRGRSADGSIRKGARVRVRGVDGLILRVVPEPEDDEGAGEA